MSWLIAGLLLVLGVLGTAATDTPLPLFAAIILAAITVASLQIAKAWERAVILRMGRFQSLVGPGLFLFPQSIPLLPGSISAYREHLYRPRIADQGYRAG